MARQLEKVFDLYTFMGFTSQCFCREGEAKALFWGGGHLSVDFRSSLGFWNLTLRKSKDECI